MKEYSIAMSLVDYIPVLLFLAAAVLLQRDLYNKLSKGAFALFSAGTIFVFCAGFLKATYKLLYAAGVCDFAVLSDMFFPTQALGFLLAGVGILAMLCHKQGETGLAAAAPALFKGTFIFVGTMVAGVLCMNIGLSVLAAKMKKPLASVLFVIAIVLMLSMGYLSSKDFTAAYMNWAAEIVNIFGQGTLLSAVLVLHKVGLRDFELKKQEQ